MLVGSVGGAAAPLHLCMIGVVLALLGVGYEQRAVGVVVAEVALKHDDRHEGEHDMSAEGVALVVGQCGAVGAVGADVEEAVMPRGGRRDGVLPDGHHPAGGCQCDAERAVLSKDLFRYRCQPYSRQAVEGRAVPADAHLRPDGCGQQ